jgi:hypothetical protein
VVEILSMKNSKGSYKPNKQILEIWSEKKTINLSYPNMASEAKANFHEQLIFLQID